MHDALQYTLAYEFIYSMDAQYLLYQLILGPSLVSEGYTLLRITLNHQSKGVILCHVCCFVIDLANASQLRSSWDKLIPFLRPQQRTRSTTEYLAREQRMTHGDRHCFVRHTKGP